MRSQPRSASRAPAPPPPAPVVGGIAEDCAILKPIANGLPGRMIPLQTMPPGPAAVARDQYVMNGRDRDVTENAASIYTYLASDLAKDITGDVFVASGGFIGRLPRPTLSVLAYRDSDTTPPWSPTELGHALSRQRRQEESR